MRRAVGIVVAVGIAATLLTVVFQATRSGTRLAGTNDVDAGSFNIALRDGQRFCQPMRIVPKDANRVRMTIGAYGPRAPELDLVVTANGRRIVATRVPSGQPEGVVTLPLGTTTREAVENAKFCITPRGRKIALGGFQDQARVEWLRPGKESYASMLGVVAHRLGLARAGFLGSFTLLLLLALVVAIWTLAVRLVLREARP